MERMNANRVRQKLDRWAVMLGEASSRRLWPDFQYTIRLDHPVTSDLRPRYGFGRPPHPKLESLISSRRAEFAAQLQGFAQFFDDLADISMTGERSVEPCWINPWLIGLDTTSLYSYMRTRKPANYVEVGSGQSTKVVARARKDGEASTIITSIDPQPRSEIDELCDKVLRTTLEEADLERCFGRLVPGDIVFFDGSHRVLPNSDCVAFFLDVLPALPAGVLVGIHDIYLPEDYPEGFLELWWSEQYVLAAILIFGGPRLDVVLPTFYVSGVPELAQLLDPLFSRPAFSGLNRRGSVFWVETTGA